MAFYNFRQIYSIIFVKEYYSRDRFEVGNNINKKVYICHSDQILVDFMFNCREDKNNLLYDCFKSYPTPLVVVHGKNYDRTYTFHYNEDDVYDNKYNLKLEEMDKKVKEIARKYLNDGYGSINILKV